MVHAAHGTNPGLRRICLLCALLCVAAATLTPGAAGNGLSSPGFWCVACDPLAGADIVANTLLFIPLGAALAWNVGPWRAAAIGALLSAVIEMLQHLGVPGGRDASITDILANTLGAVVGAQLGAHWQALFLPNERQAKVLTAAGVAGTVLLLAFTGWALGRPAPDNPRVPIVQSALRVTPAFGWYHGYVLNARIGATDYPHAGDGPLILQGVLHPHDSVAVSVAYRDERKGLVPLVYMHKDNSTLPELIIGQSGIDMRVRLSLRAQKLRLSPVELILRNAFRDSGREVRALHVALHPDKWTAESELRGVTARAELPLTLSLGWVLLQRVVALNSAGSALLSFAWMLVLFAPAAYWGTLYEKHRAVLLPVSATILASALLVIPVYARLSPTSRSEWTNAVIGFLVGIGCGVFVARRRSAP